MRVLFLARTLRMGGAERQLVALARGLRRGGHDVAVAVFYAGGRFEEELRGDGISVHDLAKSGRWDTLAFALRLVKLVRRERPDVLHSYLDSPNLAAAALKRFFPSVKVVWGIRSSKTDFQAYDWLQGASARAERVASPLADGVIANSEAARRRLLEAGFSPRDLVVIPNGIDCDAFRPDPAGRERLRAEWSVPAGHQLVGLVARLDPVKDHPTFLRAAGRVAAARPDVRFVCVGGGGSGEYRERLVRLAREQGLEARLTWAGERRVTRAEYSAFDVAVLSSLAGEGFPNVLAEAMACGSPVVATDSGDARAIVGDTGVVVPPKDFEALARGICATLDRLREPGAGAGPTRARIEAEYSVDALVRRTTEALERIRAGGLSRTRGVTRIAHVITGLTAGGAEEMLLKLLEIGRGDPRTSVVISLTDIGPIGARISALGVPVHALGMHRGRPDPAALFRLVALLRRERPDVVQTWMYHSDLLGGVAARLLGVPVVWGVRHDTSCHDKALTRATRLACALLSRWVPQQVVFNSNTARRSHAAGGYATRKLVVVPNGFDLARFRPDPVARAELRRELGIPARAPVVGIVARFHPDKGHDTFARAAARVRAARPDVHFVLCGDGVDWADPELSRLLEGAGLRDVAHLLGARVDVERVFAALDVACLASRTESFPNVLGEAMACGVPCVATDCGDVRAVVGAAGRVVPIGDAAAMGDALLEMLQLEPAAREALAVAARAHVAASYGLPSVARRFGEVQDEAIRAASGRG